MTTARLAAVLYSAGKGLAADAVLAEATGVLRAEGWRLGGAVQFNTPVEDRCACDMTLLDLGSGRVVDISENRGPLARGCRLNAVALEEITGLAAASLTVGVDLLVVNKFGKREIEGHGFRQAIEAAVASGVPVIALVSEDNLGGWAQFTQGMDERLRPDVGAVVAWCRAAAATRTAVDAVTTG
jgi:nucleoside-triphosphatase THEP1